MIAERPQDEETPLEEGPHFVDEPPTDEGPAWEQMAAGRFMPRRIRGSYRGRALG